MWIKKHVQWYVFSSRSDISYKNIRHYIIFNHVDICAFLNRIPGSSGNIFWGASTSAAREGHGDQSSSWRLVGQVDFQMLGGKKCLLTWFFVPWHWVLPSLKLAAVGIWPFPGMEPIPYFQGALAVSFREGIIESFRNSLTANTEDLDARMRS